MASSRESGFAHGRFFVADRAIDVDGLLIVHEGRRTRVAPRLMSLLTELAAQPGQTVSRRDLLDRVWGPAANTPDVLNYAITDLRRALGDDAKSPCLIETVPRLGYRLIAPVGAKAPMPAAAPASSVAPAAGAPRWPYLFALLALAATLATFVFVRRDATVATATTATTVAPSAGANRARFLTSNVGSEYQPTIDAAGTHVAYVRQERSGQPILESRRIHDGVPSDLSKPVAGAIAFPNWSGAAGSIAYLQQVQAPEIELVVRTIAQAEPRILDRCQWAVTCLFDWLPDGSAIVRLEQAGPPRAWGITTGLRVVPMQGAPHRLALPQTPVGEFDFDPKLSPDGKRLAFRRGHPPIVDLHVVDLAGGPERAVTTIGGGMLGFDWLRDGRHLVFSSDHRGKRELFVVCADGSDCAPRPLGVEDAAFPRASRQSDRIVFEKQRWATQLRRTDLTAVAPEGDERAAEDPVLFPSTGVDRDPAISPDGRRVAFVSNRAGQDELWLGNVDGSSLRRLSTHPEGSIRFPRWAPAGDAVLFVVRRERIGTVWVVDAVRGSERELRLPHDDVRSACQVDDIGTLVYAARQAGGWQLFEFAPATSAGAARQLTRDGGFDPQAVDNGRQVLFQQPNGDALQRLDRRDGRISELPIRMLPWQIGFWQATANGIAHIVIEPQRGRTLGFSDLDGKRRSLVPLPADYAWVAGMGPLAVSGDERTLIRVSRPAPEIDIGLLDGPIDASR